MKTTDVELIHRVLDGDDTAFTVLVKKYQKPVHALVWRKIGDFHIAEEITQDTFLKAYQELATLKKPQSFSSWLYVIAANNCSTWLRKKRLRTEPLEDARLQKATYSGYVVAENERVTAEAQREAVKKLLAKLQESDRTVITLHYFGEMSSSEIGAFLGVSANTVRSRLRRAQQRLKREEPMIREALENFQITPNFTENIMREIARLKPAAPSGGKPFIPWVIGVSAVAIVLLMFGLSNQSLLRFQKPYSFNAASEMKVELIDAPVVRNLEAEPDDRTQLGNANAQDKNNGVGNQVDDAASLDLETLITQMKHSDNAVTSVTGDFVMERHQDQRSGKNEYTLMFEGGKVQVEQAEGWPIIGYWDGERSWEGAKNRRMIFEFEIPSGKEKTELEPIRQAFKHNGIDLADDVRIVDGDEPESFTLVENETGTTYFFWLEGETTLLVYDYHLEYSVRPQWLVPSDYDPRFWLTFPSLGSNNSYLSEPLWHLLEKHESEIIGSEILNGEKTSVIRLDIPAWSTEDFKMPAESYKLWVSHDKGFRLVKSERAFTVENPTEWSSYKAGVTYISTRKIEHHEYLPDVWFPKRIESITVPKASPEQQQDAADFVYKNVLLTKECRINTDVTAFLSLRLPPDTPVFDYGEGQQSFVENVLNPKPKPDILTQYESDEEVYDPAPHDLQTVIDKMKHYDSAIVSASGDFVIEHYMDSGIAKTQYALTFEGKKIRVEQKRDFPTLDKDVPLIKRLLPLVKIYDGKQQWEIYKYKKLLFSLEVTPDKAAPILETIRQAFKQQGTKLADDVRIVASEQPDSYTLIENQTGKSYFILWEADTTLKVYDLNHLEYGVWYQRNILSDLDPRYWLTYPGEGESAYLTEPLWQLLEKHESKLLGSELLNGEETSVIRLNLPKQSLKLWISHNKGFRLVQLDSAFIAKRPVASMQFQVGNIYVETRKIEHHEYLPDVWFPKKIERYYTPLTDPDPQREDQVILKRTVVHTQQCRLNTDVAALLRLDLRSDTPILGLKPERDAPKAEKVAFLRQEIPRTLNLRLDMLKLVGELAEFHAKDPDISLLRNQTYDESRKLIWIISNLGHRYTRLTNDGSAFKSGGEFHALMKQNGIGISGE
ncbi:RNA polymerase sigma factor [Candidatus Poribacteria bacterium]|nr:RNA polymerase sigma factor [Candidatus Poribacteria bacterium]MYH80873.1 RNA polymerase sigma factor [Candidatus Poribacteria bacterium]MYK92472.1 RNA polymerase sigma factor [Candidatus Poribacteria bacterium]